MPDLYRHPIEAVAPGSIAAELELQPGDTLLSIDGQPVQDALDYRFFCHAEALVMEVEKGPGPYIGEVWELDIEKEPEEDLGLTFSSSLMDNTRECVNRCIFCFVAQQPTGLRPSLYVRDDDVRLSFLTGNYVTLTNVDDAELDRIIRYRMSPIRVSVHAACEELRVRMMGTPRAAGLMPKLRKLAHAGIELHFQVVLCKGINDGAHLDETIAALVDIGAKCKTSSLAVVPAGLTRHREGLPFIPPFSAEDAAAVLAQVQAWQEKCRQRMGTAFVFAADEWHVLAPREWRPPYTHYEDFPQLDNGVGLISLFVHQFAEALRKAAREWEVARPAPVAGIVTGVAAAPLMRAAAALFMSQFPGPRVYVFAIENHFFGPQVTVSGLLTGQDIISQLRGQLDGIPHQMSLFLPPQVFRAGTETLLDGTTRADIQDALGVTVVAGDADGGGFCRQLMGLR